MSEVLRLNQFEIKMLEEYRQYRIRICEDMISAGFRTSKVELEQYKSADLHQLVNRCILTAFTESKEYCDKMDMR